MRRICFSVLKRNTASVIDSKTASNSLARSDNLAFRLVESGDIVGDEHCAFYLTFNIEEGSSAQQSVNILPCRVDEAQFSARDGFTAQCMRDW